MPFVGELNTCLTNIEVKVHLKFMYQRNEFIISRCQMSLCVVCSHINQVNILTKFGRPKENKYLNQIMFLHSLEIVPSV
jgi:hypothetical protein